VRCAKDNRLPMCYLWRGRTTRAGVRTRLPPVHPLRQQVNLLTQTKGAEHGLGHEVGRWGEGGSF
jgi:hypothetical protein